MSDCGGKEWRCVSGECEAVVVGVGLSETPLDDRDLVNRKFLL